MTLQADRLKTGDQLPPLVKTLSQAKIDQFESLSRLVRAPDGVSSLPSNMHTDAAQARRMGMTRPIASGQMSFAFLHELLARTFGDDFLWGGELTVTFIKPVGDGDTITVHGQVQERQDTGRRARFLLDVWIENSSGDKTATGQARVTVPSLLRE
ncbi:MAG: hypothetical protein FJ316_11640 [SAR202 cluster bacterium]|nr:hypothetical protein [SAR202 cluster bacterium]